MLCRFVSSETHVAKSANLTFDYVFIFGDWILQESRVFSHSDVVARFFELYLKVYFIALTT